jgi:hypothetical protein
MMMEAVRASKISVDSYFTRQYIPEDNSEHQLKDSFNPSEAVVYREYFIILPVYVSLKSSYQFVCIQNIFLNSKTKKTAYMS